MNIHYPGVPCQTGIMTIFNFCNFAINQRIIHMALNFKPRNSLWPKVYYSINLIYWFLLPCQ